MSNNWLKLIRKVQITKHFLQNELLRLAIKARHLDHLCTERSSSSKVSL